jgi:NAD(P)-dependent dehydrogenase (short-subunit alcohol dehydrogenase family)
VRARAELLICQVSLQWQVITLSFLLFLFVVLSPSSGCPSAGPPLGGVYAATKGAIESFSDSLRREVAHFGVSVSIIEPCYVATNLLSTATTESSQTTGASSASSVPVPTVGRTGTEAEHRALYAHLYTPQIEAMIRYCIRCASHPQVTTTAIQV